MVTGGFEPPTLMSSEDAGLPKTHETSDAAVHQGKPATGLRCLDRAESDAEMACPPGHMRVADVSAEPRVGGAYSIAIANHPGEGKCDRTGVAGTYTKVEPNQSLAFTWVASRNWKSLSIKCKSNCNHKATTPIESPWS